MDDKHDRLHDAEARFFRNINRPFEIALEIFRATGELPHPDDPRLHDRDLTKA